MWVNRDWPDLARGIGKSLNSENQVQGNEFHPCRDLDMKAKFQATSHKI